MIEVNDQVAPKNGPAQDNRDTIDNDERNVDVEAKLLENSLNSPQPEAKSNGGKSGEKTEQDRTMTEDINKLLRDMPLTDDVTCGFWFLKGPFFQKFANQTAYVTLYGLVGCIISMLFAYFNGTITTLEKRFKIPSRNTGIIAVGNDTGQLLMSGVLSYYAGKGHRPRWLGIGLLSILLFCLLTAAPHFVYGPGEDALALTVEFGATYNQNVTSEAIDQEHTKSLCNLSGGAGCEIREGNLAPQVMLFLGHVTSGIGESMYFTLGISYMDDNTKKSKAPALLSLSYFLRLLGPAVGYALASFCLRIYIAPQLRPVITDKDPRWLGAWWLGWIILGAMLFVAGICLTMFPKDLPRAVARRMVEEKRRKQRQSLRDETKTEGAVVEEEASFKDMLKTFRRLTTNKTLMCNNFSSIFYFFGYCLYWIFTPKYIEVQYRQSAATSNMVTGTVAVVFAAVGILLAGFVISKYKPRARYLAAWNVIVGFLTVAGIVTYAFIGCPGNEKSVIVNIHDSTLDSTPSCNSACNCDYVRYAPVCGENSMTYISPCHAGCKKLHVGELGKKVFYDCACIPNSNYSSIAVQPIFERLSAMDLTSDDIESTSSLPTSLTTSYPDALLGGQAIPGACPVNCFTQFVTFLAVMCCLQFLGAAGRASNFLVAVRCVPEKDKTASMGLSVMMQSLFALIPSPIFFGWLMDRLCVVWGKTCSDNGNCWLYDSESLRYTLNSIAAVFIALGALFDCGVWYYVKDLKIFDDEDVKEIEMEIIQQEEEVLK